MASPSCSDMQIELELNNDIAEFKMCKPPREKERERESKHFRDAQ